MPPKSGVTVSLFQKQLNSLLDPAWINLDLKADSDADAIRQTCARLTSHRAVVDLLRLERDILQREQMQSVKLAPGISFPHARSRGVRDFVLAITRWQPIPPIPAPQTANILILLGTPAGRVTDHLAVVSGIAGLFTQPELHEELLAAGSPHDFLAALKLRL